MYRLGFHLFATFNEHYLKRTRSPSWSLRPKGGGENTRTTDPVNLVSVTVFTVAALRSSNNQFSPPWNSKNLRIHRHMESHAIFFTKTDIDLAVFNAWRTTKYRSVIGRDHHWHGRNTIQLRVKRSPETHGCTTYGVHRLFLFLRVKWSDTILKHILTMEYGYVPTENHQKYNHWVVWTHGVFMIFVVHFPVKSLKWDNDTNTGIQKWYIC